jgi:monovalent cation:H+ antiporter-2, CPA2 family
MPDAHAPALIPTIAVGLALAFIGGLIAKRLGMPSIVGYLLAGVAIGPFTPGIVADAELAQELAEIGVVLLMFGVGLHFSLRDLFAVRSIAIPGAIGQIAVASVLGTLLGLALGWPLQGAVVLGLSISVASTVVLIRALVDRGELLSAQGRIAVGWLIVEDLFTVVILVLLPSLAAFSTVAGAADDALLESLAGVILAILKAALFALIIVVIGVRLLPRLLAHVAGLRDREMFTLAAVAIALGIAYLSFAVFGVSLALGAFLAGAVVNESDTNDQVDADARPLREVFSVLFFVAVGMLFDPAYALANVPAIAAVVLVIVVAKAVTAFAIVAAMGYPPRVGLTVAAGLAQVGEFSFILASAAGLLGLLPAEGLQLVVGASLVSITINPFLFRAIDPLARRMGADRRVARIIESRSPSLTSIPATDENPGLRGHAVVIGSGRVGRLIIGALARRGFPFVVVSDDRRDIERLRAQGRPALFGDASNTELLDRASVASARVVVVAIPDAHVARLIIQHARRVNPRVALVVRTHDQRHLAEVASLEGHAQAIHGELELGVQMTRYTLRRFGISTIEAEAIAEGLRGRGGRPWPLDPM